MVKFTSASALLVLANLSAFTWASPTATTPGNFSIVNHASGLYIYSDGTEKVNDSVVTTSTYNQANTAVGINLEPQPKSFSGVQGAAGLYASIVNDTAGQTVIWAEKSYPWSFTMLNESDPASGYTIKVIGEKLYWYDYDNGTITIATTIDASSTFAIESA